MSTQEYEYHIYVKDQCLYNCLSEEEFNIRWNELNAMVGLMKTEYSVEDLDYIKVQSYETQGYGGGLNGEEPSY